LSNAEHPPTWSPTAPSDVSSTLDTCRTRPLRSPRISREEFEPLDEIEPELHVSVRTDRDIRDLIDEVEAALDARLARSR